MTPLQEAAKVVKDEMSLPTCGVCNGYGKDPVVHVAPCRECGGCGVDTSEPRVIAAEAMLWLDAHRRSPALCDGFAVCLWFAWEPAPQDWVAAKHDGTHAGVATALLQLVAKFV